MKIKCFLLTLKTDCKYARKLTNEQSAILYPQNVKKILKNIINGLQIGLNFTTVFTWCKHKNHKCVSIFKWTDPVCMMTGNTKCSQKMFYVHAH